MIDFRYHLVSLISVFLALAVGIVLGAGPLRESIGDTLTEQVQQLRDEKDTLRADVATADAGIEHRDAFVDAVSERLVVGSLTGRRVAVVRLPGVEDAALEPVTDTLGLAGATVTRTVEIRDAWTAADQQTLREQLTEQLSGTVPGGVTGTGNPAQLAGLLARGLVTAGPTTGEAAETAAAVATEVLSALEGADLISLEGDDRGLADAVVVLAPGLERVTGNQTQPTPSTDDLTSYVAVARALDADGKGAVLAGPASSATNGGVVQAVRRDEVTNRIVSTVDSGGTPMGVVTSVLALREQLGGSTGRYGFGDGATAPLPEAAGTTP